MILNIIGFAMSPDEGHLLTRKDKLFSLNFFVTVPPRGATSGTAEFIARGIIQNHPRDIEIL